MLARHAGDRARGSVDNGRRPNTAHGAICEGFEAYRAEMPRISFLFVSMPTIGQPLALVVGPQLGDVLKLLVALGKVACDFVLDCLAMRRAQFF